MRLLNRCALVVRAREPFIRWVCTRDAEAAKLEKHIVGHVYVYLLDENLRGDAETPSLKNYYKAIFEHELAAWDKLETRWPKKRDLATFLEWFDVAGQSMVFDLGRDEIEGEEFLLR